MNLVGSAPHLVRLRLKSCTFAAASAKLFSRFGVPSLNLPTPNVTPTQ
jgi:hypothetical protein